MSDSRYNAILVVDTILCSVGLYIVQLSCQRRRCSRGVANQVFQLYNGQHRESEHILDILKRRHMGWSQQNSQQIPNHQRINQLIKHHNSSSTTCIAEVEAVSLVFSCRSRQTTAATMIAPALRNRSTASRIAVPAVITSSTTSTRRPLMGAPTNSPPYLSLSTSIRGVCVTTVNFRYRYHHIHDTSSSTNTSPWSLASLRL